MTMMNHEQYGVGATMDSVYNELNQLQSCYQEYLDQESLISEVRLLKQMIEDCQIGSPEAEEMLRAHGGEILRLLSDKLKLAAEEQERLQEESPAVARRDDGRAAHRLSRALALVADAQQKLDTSLHTDFTH